MITSVKSLTPKTNKELGLQRLQTKREYFEYEDRSLCPSIGYGFIRIRNSSQQSESWSIVEKRNEDTHAVSLVRNGAHCTPYYQVGAYKKRDHDTPDSYWLVEALRPDGSYEKLASGKTLDKALYLARRCLAQIMADLKISTDSGFYEVSTPRNYRYQGSVQREFWNQPNKDSNPYKIELTRTVAPPVVAKPPKAKEEAPRRSKMALVIDRKDRIATPSKKRNGKVTVRRMEA